MSLPYSFDIPGQLKNWLGEQEVSPKLYCFGNKFLFVVPGVSAARLSESSESSSS